MILEVILSTTIACIQDDCVSVIVGKPKTPTPIGYYQTYYATTKQYGYDSELIVFKENSTKVWAIHKPYKTLHNKNYRELILKDINSNKFISNGCINVPSEFFDKYKYQIDGVNIVK